MLHNTKCSHTWSSSYVKYVWTDCITCLLPSAIPPFPSPDSDCQPKYLLLQGYPTDKKRLMYIKCPPVYHTYAADWYTWVSLFKICQIIWFHIIRMLTNHTFALTTPSWNIELLGKYYQIRRNLSTKFERFPVLNHLQKKEGMPKHSLSDS